MVTMLLWFTRLFETLVDNKGQDYNVMSHYIVFTCDTNSLSRLCMHDCDISRYHACKHVIKQYITYVSMTSTTELFFNFQEKIAFKPLTWLTIYFTIGFIMTRSSKLDLEDGIFLLVVARMYRPTW